MSNRQQNQGAVWTSGAAYESYVGRWSRFVANAFLDWLSLPFGSQWLDVGCGTGALSQIILQRAAPASVTGVDSSEGYIAYAQDQIRDEHAKFEVGDAQALSVENSSYDAAVSGLMLNFLPQPDLAINEMARAVKPNGVVALYVWDYAGEMQLMRHFWNAAVTLDPQLYNLDEGHRFPICSPQALTALFQSENLKNIEVRAIDIQTHFKDFDDYWTPFLGGQGAAPSYAMSLGETQRAALREKIRAGLPFALDGSIPLIARAWAVRGLR